MPLTSMKTNLIRYRPDDVLGLARKHMNDIANELVREQLQHLADQSAKRQQQLEEARRNGSKQVFSSY